MEPCLCWSRCLCCSWRRSRPGLGLALGFALFVLTGGFSLLTGYWLAPELRIVHGLEILVDSALLAAVLVILLVKAPAGDRTVNR